MGLGEIISLLVKISIMLLVFGLGLKATWQDATFLLHHPGLWLRSLLAMNVVMPIVALGVCTLLGIRPSIETSLVILMVSPVAPFLPTKQMKLGNDEAYAYGLLTVQAVLAIVLVPISLLIIARLYGMEVRVVPGTITSLVMLTTVVPLLAGIGVRVLFPAFSERVADLLIHLAFLVLVLAFLPVLVMRGPALLAMVGNGTLLGMVLVSTLGVVVGHLLGGPEQIHRGTLALATAMRHPGVVLAVVAANRGDVKEVSAAVLLYLLVGTIVTMLYMKWSSHRHPTHPGGFRRDTA